MEKLTISRLAQLGGVNSKRFATTNVEGCCPKPPRTEAGYRQFSPDAARRPRFIKRAQELGFSLEEVRELLALRIEPRKNRARFRARAEAKITDIDRKIAALDAMRVSLRGLAERCEHCAPSSKCPILASLDQEGLQ